MLSAVMKTIKCVEFFPDSLTAKEAGKSWSQGRFLGLCLVQQ